MGKKNGARHEKTLSPVAETTNRQIIGIEQCGQKLRDRGREIWTQDRGTGKIFSPRGVEGEGGAA